MPGRQNFGQCAIVCWGIGAILGLLTVVTCVLLAKMGLIWALLLGLFVTAVLGSLLTLMLCKTKDAPAAYVTPGGGATAADDAAKPGPAPAAADTPPVSDPPAPVSETNAYETGTVGLSRADDPADSGAVADHDASASDTNAYETGTVGLTRADDDMEGDMRIPPTATGAAGGEARAFGAAPEPLETERTSDTSTDAATADVTIHSDIDASGEAATTQEAADTDIPKETAEEGELGQYGSAETDPATDEAVDDDAATGETVNDDATDQHAADDTDETRAPEPAAGAASTEADPSGPGRRPDALSAPRDGGADNLKEIKGVGPKLEQLLHSLGFYHFDQIARWTSDEVSWVDQNLKGFKGRVSRDNWVDQAKTLAAGGETEFSKKVSKGDVY